MSQKIIEWVPGGVIIEGRFRRLVYVRRPAAPIRNPLACGADLTQASADNYGGFPAAVDSSQSASETASELRRQIHLQPRLALRCQATHNSRRVYALLRRVF